MMSEDAMTKEEIVARCKAAAEAIDIATCEIMSAFCNVADPYDVEPEGYVLVGRVPFVRSSESDGWVCLYWLPHDKAKALHARIDRIRKGLEQYCEDDDCPF
ncbi:hypothetical protein [Bradyrhizobium sp. USDA 3650]